MRKERKHYTAEEKVAILRKHLVERVPISDLCDELGLQPTVFYRWQKEFFENGAAAFQQRGRTNHQPEQERIAYLEKKIQTKDEVLAELMAEHVALKKELGNSDRGLGSARYAGPDRGFRPALVGKDRDRRWAVHRVARHHSQQVLRLARAVRQECLCRRTNCDGQTESLPNRTNNVTCEVASAKHQLTMAWRDWH